MSNNGSVYSRKRISPEKVTGKIAVNAVRDFFERNSQVYLEVDQSNDYGKDAYIDLAENGEVTGLVIAVQVKGGQSYRRDSTYYIRYSSSDRNLWVDSSVPVFGIVHDEERSCLHWVNLTSELLDRPSDKHGTVEAKIRLDESTWPDFYQHAVRAAKLGGRSLLGLYSNSLGQQHAAISDCFAIGRFDPRAFIMLRRSLPYLPPESAEHAVYALAHCVTYHPDRFWTEHNTVSDKARAEVLKSLNWKASEAAYLLSLVDEENMFERGTIGQDVYLLLSSGWGPDTNFLFDEIIELAVKFGDMELAYKALVIIQYRAEGDAHALLFDIVRRHPGLFKDTQIRKLLVAVQIHGWLDIS